MIAILLTWVIAGFIAWCLGRGTYALLSKSSDSKTDPPFILYILLGFSSSIFIAHLWSLFLPTNYYLLLLLGIVSAIIFWRIKRHKLQLQPIDFYVYLPLLVLSLMLSVGAPNNLDEAAYYLPTVRWMENFPVVQGISLLIDRVGFNSGFHLLSATFGLADFIPGGIYELNGFLFLFINGHLWKLILTRKSDANRPWFDLVYVAALLFPFSYLVPSMDTDYLSIFGGILVLGWISQIWMTEAKPDNAKILAISWIIAMLCTVKFLAILLTIPFLLSLIKQKNKRLFIQAGVLMTLFIAPWIVRNIITSGYTVFPLHHIDFWQVAWKAPQELTKDAYDYISEFAKVSIVREDYNLSGVQEWTMASWLPIWLENQWQYAIGKVTIVLLPFAKVAGIIILIMKRKSELEKRRFFIFWLCLTAILSFWFYKYPAIRFAWHWILVYITMTIGYLIYCMKKSWLPMVYRLLVVLVILSWTRLAYRSIQTTYSQFSSKFMIHEHHNVKIKHEIKIINNIEFKVAEDNCGGLLPPCIPARNPYNVITVGPTINSGFVIKD